jgi:thiamine kinase-like enzyme
MNSLERNHHKLDGANKYHINCNELEKNPSSIPIILEKVIKNNNDITILQSVIRDTSITEINKNIVVKIGKVNKTIEKEYKIGKFLEKLNLSGFINYICLFSCYDNTYQNIRLQNNTNPLCSAKKEEDYLKTVLIMPYIHEGSIRTFKWNYDKYDALKSIILQTVTSVFIAYQICGFLHNDLHLDNILIKKTKKESISYKLQEPNFDIDIKTYGYKVVIMDFENSMLVIKNKDGLSTYWNNLLNMISRLHYELRNKDNDKISIINLAEITSFIERQEISSGSAMNTVHLLEMIKKIKITVIKQLNQKLIYNPDVI